MEKARRTLRLEEIVEEVALLAAKFPNVPAPHPRERGPVGKQGVGKAGVRAALIEQRGRDVIHLNGREAVQAIGLSQYGIAGLIEHCRHLGIIFIYRRNRSIESDAVGPHDRRDRAPIVFNCGVMHIGGEAEAVVEITVAEYCGIGFRVVMIAVTPGNAMFVGEVMVQLDVKLPGANLGYEG